MELALSARASGDSYNDMRHLPLNPQPHINMHNSTVSIEHIKVQQLHA